MGCGDAGAFRRNASEDYLITTHTGAIGMAAPSWTQFVMIDTNGLPVPWLRRTGTHPFQ